MQQAVGGKNDYSSTSIKPQKFIADVLISFVLPFLNYKSKAKKTYLAINYNKQISMTCFQKLVFNINKMERLPEGMG
jgi:hypothetical protein